MKIESYDIYIYIYFPLGEGNYDQIVNYLPPHHEVLGPLSGNYIFTSICKWNKTKRKKIKPNKSMLHTLHLVKMVS